MLAKKIVASIICLSMAAMVAPGVSQAATAAELQAQIEALQQQLAALMSQLESQGGTTTTTTSIAACAGITFTQNLTVGSTGADVKCLQALLNQSADTQVAASGVGSSGNETVYFGGLTKTAVIKFQEKYASEILAPVGLTAGTGFVGPSTRTKLNAMLTAAEEEEEEEEGEEEEEEEEEGEEEEEEEEEEEATEGTITVTKNPSPASGTKVYEGDEGVAVLGLKMKAKGSSMTVERIKLGFGTTKPYDYLAKMYVYADDAEKMSKDLNSSTVYKEGSNYYITLTGIDTKISKDAEKVLTIKVDAKDAIDRSLTLTGSSEISISVPANAVRAVDGLGLNQYSPAASTDITAQTVNVEQTQASEASITVSKNSNSPLARNVASGTDGEVDGVTLLVFDVKAQKDTVKLTAINNVAFSAYSTTTLLAPTTAYLYDSDGNLISSASVSSDEADFSDIEVYVNKDSTKTFTVKGDFDSVLATETTCVTTVDTTSDITAENSRGTTVDDTSYITGSAASDQVYLFQKAPVFTLASVTTSSTESTDTASSTISATFSIQVKAEGGEVWIPKSRAFTMYYYVDNASTGTALTSPGIYSKPSGITEGTNAYKISENETVTFTVSATQLYPGTAGQYDIRVENIKWGTSDLAYNGTGILTSSYMPTDFKSDAKYLQ